MGVWPQMAELHPTLCSFSSKPQPLTSAESKTGHTERTFSVLWLGCFYCTFSAHGQHHPPDSSSHKNGRLTFQTNPFPSPQCLQKMATLLQPTTVPELVEMCRL